MEGIISFLGRNPLNVSLTTLFVSVFSFMFIHRDQNHSFWPIPTDSNTILYEDFFVGEISDRQLFIQNINNMLNTHHAFDDVQVYEDILRYYEEDHEFRKLEFDLAAYAKLKRQLVGQMRQNRLSIEKLNYNIDNHQEMIAKLKNNYAIWKKLQLEYNDIEFLIQQLEDAKKRFQKEKAELIAECNRLQKEIDDLTAQIEKLKREIARLIRIIQEYQECQGNYIAADKELEILEQELVEEEILLQEEITKRDRRIELINLKISTKTEMQEMASQMKKICDLYAQIHKQKDILHNEFMTQHSSIKGGMKYQSDDFDKKVEDFKRKTNVQEQKNEANSVRTDYTGYQSHVAEDVASFEACKIDFSCFSESKCDSYKSDINRFRVEIIELEKELQDIKNEQTIPRIRVEVQNTKIKISDWRDKRQKAEDCMNRLKITMKNDGYDEDSIEQALIEKEDYLTTLQNKLMNLKHELNNLDCDRGNFPQQDELTRLKMQLIELERKIEDIKKPISDTCYDCRGAVSRLKQEKEHFTFNHREFGNNEQTVLTRSSLLIVELHRI